MQNCRVPQRQRADVAAAFPTLYGLQLHSSTVNTGRAIGSLRLSNEQRCVSADKGLLMSNLEQERIKNVKVQEP